MEVAIAGRTLAEIPKTAHIVLKRFDNALVEFAPRPSDPKILSTHLKYPPQIDTDLFLVHYLADFPDAYIVYLSSPLLFPTETGDFVVPYSISDHFTSLAVAHLALDAESLQIAQDKHVYDFKHFLRNFKSLESIMIVCHAESWEQRKDKEAVGTPHIQPPSNDEENELVAKVTRELKSFMKYVDDLYDYYDFVDWAPPEIYYGILRR